MNKNIEKIINFFEENETIFNEAIEELDNYNGYLGDDRYYLMEELDELYYDVKPTEILTRAFCGYDEDYRANDNEDPAPFNPNREYFNLNGYGNLVSSDYKDYSYLLTEDTINEMGENRYYIDIINKIEELASLFDELENEEGEK